jgi:hypothetical protein
MEINSLRCSGSVGQTPGIPEELYNSADKILAYAGISQENADLFKSNLESFINMKDKSFSEGSSRAIRVQLSTTFFEAYTSVFKRVQEEDNSDQLYIMFLNFGYMDERLLSVEQTNTLYKLAKEFAGHSIGSVYHLKPWLQEIYQRNQEPSVNEFGLDYHEVFAEIKRQKEVTDKDKPAYDADLDGRLNHEITNLFKLGQRLCYGQTSGYFPILHREMISHDLEASLVTPAKIEASINKILAVDFSAFHREIVFTHTNRQLAHELIMKPVFPDIILIPCFGHRSVMWQVLSGKVKTSPGRFLFPLFTNEDLDDMMIDAVAQFRWDLSKNMSSYVINKANDISLYSDYSDYIQFYAKNRDLSADAREKLKTVIKRHRNSPRNIFAADYQTWINYESNGLLRLNKVAREILFKHCPFSRTIRDNLLTNPQYNAIITQFDKARLRQCKILEARYMKVNKSGNIDPDLTGNMIYYKA